MRKRFTHVYVSVPRVPDDALNGQIITPAFSDQLPNIAGKSRVALTVYYLPGGRTPPHRHGSAFVAGFVISGSIRSQLDDEEPRVYHAGESWSEDPGTYHKISENANIIKPTSLLATYVVESDYKQLAMFDCPTCEVVKDVLAP
jgi:quercetin dioxygenase-like cupin family protein